MSECIFCKIINKEIPSVKVYEDDMLWVMMDLFPESKGHCLIIPKRHVKHLYDIDEASLKEVVKMSQKLAIACKKALSADGVRIMQFNESVAGQTVFHYHMHVIPAYQNTPIGRHHSGEPEQLSVLEAISQKIKEALADEN